MEGGKTVRAVYQHSNQVHMFRSISSAAKAWSKESLCYNIPSLHFATLYKLYRALLHFTSCFISTMSRASRGM